MKNRIVIYVKKYEELISYLIVGGLNTVLAWASWLLLSRYVFDPHIIWQNVMLSVMSWLLCNGFVYVLNRVFVFKSREPNIFSEFMKFSAGRLLTLALDGIMIVLLINLCGIEEIISKIITSVTVIVVNYLISKLLIFKNQER